MAEGKYRRLECSGCFLAFTQIGAGTKKLETDAPRSCATAGCEQRFERSGKRKYCAPCRKQFLTFGVTCAHPKPALKNVRLRKICYDCFPRPAPRPRKVAEAKYKFECAWCKASASAKNPRAKFCSAGCRIAAGNDVAKTARQVQCVGCQQNFSTPSRAVRTWCSEACKRKALGGLFSCLQCGAEVRLKNSGGVRHRFCSKACSGLHKRESAPPKFSAYFAGWCRSCGKAHGHRKEWVDCPGCKQAAARLAARIAHRATSEAKHKAAGKVVECAECESQFCPLYGRQGNVSLCGVCSPVRQARQRRQTGGTNAQRAKRRGLPRKYFNEVKRVLERDGWRCQLCGIATPKKLRGTRLPNAPEVDHVVPLSAPGTPGHVPENCQCACRACNIAKGGAPKGQLSLAL